MMVEVNPGNIDKNDYYIRYKKLFIRLSIVSGILLAVFLSLAVVFWLKTDAVHPDFQTVTVKIKSVYNAQFGNDVYVIYENKEYPLINVTDSELPKYKVHCKNGMPVEVLLGSDGKFYSNINGIKTNTSTGKWYFVFLGEHLLRS